MRHGSGTLLLLLLKLARAGSRARGISLRRQRGSHGRYISRALARPLRQGRRQDAAEDAAEVGRRRAETATFADPGAAQLAHAAERHCACVAAQTAHPASACAAVARRLELTRSPKFDCCVE